MDLPKVIQIYRCGWKQRFAPVVHRTKFNFKRAKERLSFFCWPCIIVFLCPWHSPIPKAAGSLYTLHLKLHKGTHILSFILSNAIHFSTKDNISALIHLTTFRQALGILLLQHRDEGNWVYRFLFEVVNGQCVFPMRN